MVRLFSWSFLLLFLFSSSGLVAQETVFQGRVALGRDLASFRESPPVPGTLYLLTGAAAAITKRSDQPLVVDVDFVQGEWQSEAELISYRTNLRFEGDLWADVVLEKRPKRDSDRLIYPHRKFQVAALAFPGGFRVLSVTYLF